MFDSIGYYASHPEAIIYSTATALLYPVLFVEVAALIWVMLESGAFTWEMWRRWGVRSVPALEAAATLARTELSAGRPDAAAEALKAVGASTTFSGRYFASLGSGADLTRARLLKRLADLEAAMAKRLERTRVLVRVGPMLGLMGTLIPISPALVGLAQGDVATLADNLVVAFSTTVVGLLIGGLAFVISAVRDRLYALDVSDVEYVLELMEVQ